MRSSNLFLQSTPRSRSDANTVEAYPKVTNYKLGNWIISIPQLFRRRRLSRQRCSLLELPLEIVQIIVGQLPLPQRILLSQTCSDLWHVLHGDCLSAFREASLAERLDCLAVLGLFLPDHHLCAGCCALHPIAYEDLPIITPLNRCGQGVHRRFCPLYEAKFNRSLSTARTGSYATAFRHVQRAIKNHNHEGTQRQYHAALLREFSISLPDFFSLRLDVSAEPLLAKGRFLLKTTYVLRGGTQPLSLANALKTPVAICPHLSLGAVHPVGPTEPLPAALRLAFDKAGAPIVLKQDLHSCDQCPTDFLVSCKDERVRVMVWPDLGIGVSIQDLFWRFHLLRNKKKGFHGINSDYRPGSIQEMYSSNKGQPQAIGKHFMVGVF